MNTFALRFVPDDQADPSPALFCSSDRWTQGDGNGVRLTSLPGDLGAWRGDGVVRALRSSTVALRCLRDRLTASVVPIEDALADIGEVEA